MMIIKNEKCFILYILIAVLFWFLSIYFGQCIESNYKNVSIRFEKEVASIGDISNKENENMDIVLWNKGEKTSIKGILTDKEFYIKNIDIYGDMKYIFSNEFITGGYTYKNDYEGCIIDYNTAEKLFGSYNIIGNIILVDGNKYIIRGVLKIDDDIIMIQKTDKNIKFKNIEISFDEIKNIQEQTNNFLNANNLPQPASIIDGYFFSSVIKVLYLFPAIFLFIFITFKIVKNIYVLKGFPILFICSIVVGIMAIYILKAIINLKIDFPEQFIPSRWSDFEFWNQKIKEIKDGIADFNELIPLQKSLFLKRNIIFCFVCSLLSVAVFFKLVDKNIVFEFKDIMLITAFLLLIPNIIIFLFTLLKYNFLSPFCFKFMPVTAMFLNFTLVKWETFIERN